MSKPRYDWWPYAKGMIRRYPFLKAEQEYLKSQSMVASYVGMRFGAGGKSRPVEQCAQRGLSGTKLREYEAVLAAVTKTAKMPSGKERLALVRMVFWDKTHTLSGAALAIPCAQVTAWRWHGDFIRLVAKEFGLMDE